MEFYCHVTNDRFQKKKKKKENIQKQTLLVVSFELSLFAGPHPHSFLLLSFVASFCVNTSRSFSELARLRDWAGIFLQISFLKSMLLKTFRFVCVSDVTQIISSSNSLFKCIFLQNFLNFLFTHQRKFIRKVNLKSFCLKTVLSRRSPR